MVLPDDGPRLNQSLLDMQGISALAGEAQGAKIAVLEQTASKVPVQVSVYKV